MKILHYKGLELKALNLYCIHPDGKRVLQAFESPLEYDEKADHGCHEICVCGGRNAGCDMLRGNEKSILKTVCSTEDNPLIWRECK